MNNTLKPENSASVQNDQSPVKKKRFNRRVFLTIVIVGAFCFYMYNPFKPPMFKTKKKIVILGFDGTDPNLVRRWMSELPNLSKLQNSGGFSDLQSSDPPESPVAWSSFAVGANPGKHGVFDFIRRPKGSYSPSLESFVKRQYPEFLFGTIPIQLPKAILRRGGKAFWDVLSESGVPTTLIEVPVTFPPPKLSYGRSLSGLGVPDIRGLQATFHHFVYEQNPDPNAQKETTFGGKIVDLIKENDVYKGFIWGPYDPVVDQERRAKEKERVELYMELCEWDAHIQNKMSQDHVTDEQRLGLSDYLNIRVYGNMAHKEYLYDADIEARADVIRKYVSERVPFIKEESASINTARENSYKLKKMKRKLDEDINRLSKPIKANIEFRLIEDQHVEITVGTETQTVPLLKWSGWFTVYFPVTSLLKAQAICRFYPQELTANTIKIYMTSPDIDPRNPVIPVSHPKSYSQELAGWLEQPYKTRGWAAETHALKDEKLQEDGFIDDLNFIMDQREQKLFETWDRTENNVFVSVFSETDRVAHMFYRFLDKGHPMYDPIKAEKYENTVKDIYIRMDHIVGKMLNRIGDDSDTTLFVMSDHGFSSWRYQLHINTWLFQNGFLKIKGQLSNSDMKLEDLIKDYNTDFFAYVDWKGTQAYALGLGQIYINMKDREPLGIVTKEEYDDVCSRIIEGLETLRDTREGVTPFINVEDDPHKDLGGLPVVHFVKQRAEIWKGAFADDDHDCPDLQVGFYPGYRVSWQTCLGGISTGEAIEDNMETWSGDHCSLSRDYLSGMVFCNKPIRENPSIYDFAPTVLHYFGLKVPDEMEGHDLLDV